LAAISIEFGDKARGRPVGLAVDGNGALLIADDPDVEVISWYVLMGVGQVVTLRFPSEKLRDINQLIERETWGGYRTEFYPTHD
jgi:hypothetical protein